MEAVSSPARLERTQHRQELRTLTYVALDESNGGIVRNLNCQGIAVQAVAAPHAHQMVRVRFELRSPRVRVEARGEVTWTNAQGQCGIRFVDLSPRTKRQINEWIFGQLLAGLPQHPPPIGSMFASAGQALPEAEVDDGLIVSPSPRRVIQLQPPLFRVRRLPEAGDGVTAVDDVTPNPMVDLDWLSQPVSAKSLARAFDMLIVAAAFLLFSVIFLSINEELPKWAWAIALGTAIFAGLFYWGFFALFGGSSIGSRLAKLAQAQSVDNESCDAGSRFR
jgi:PilZ domain